MWQATFDSVGAIDEMDMDQFARWVDTMFDDLDAEGFDEEMEARVAVLMHKYTICTSSSCVP